MKGQNYINKDYFLPLLRSFCEETMPLYKNGEVYEQGPFIPYVMSGYMSSSPKIMYVGRDTFYWVPFDTLYNSFHNQHLEDYLDADAKCVDVDKMIEWNNNSGSFFNMVDKLHLLIRTGVYYPDITSIGYRELALLSEIGYGNLCPIEFPSTIDKRYGEHVNLEPEYWKICEAAKSFGTLKAMIEAYNPDVVFVLTWIDKEEDFFSGIDGDYTWHKELFRQSDEEKEYRAVYTSTKYQTKVIWSLHPNALSYKGFNKEDRKHLIHFLADTYHLLMA